MGIARESLREAAALERVLARELPHDTFKAIAGGLYSEGRGWLARWWRTMPGKFQSGGRRVGRAFHVYTSGRTLENLTLGIFTRWDAAELYERGGTITPKRGKWLVIPIGRRLLTAGGRVRRGVRDQNGRFRGELFEGLRPIKLRSAILLVRDVEGTPGGRVSRRAKPSGARQAAEPVFLLIRRTSRAPVLDFFGGFERDGVRMAELGRRVEGALKRAAKKRG